MLRLTSILAAAALLAGCATGAPDITRSDSRTIVEVVQLEDGSYTLMRDGEPYFIKGAGADIGPENGMRNLQMLVDSGANSIRTWGVDQLEVDIDGKPLIDRAHEMGLSILLGIWVEHPRHGFDYGDPASIERQRQHVRDAVRKYRDHPALLAWGLGNEMEAFMPGEIDVRIWKELEVLAQIIKRMDTDHPVVTVLAEVSKEKIDGIKEHYPSMDILGVNAYGSAPTVGTRALEFGWDGPYMLTEYGTVGTWEVGETSWGAPIESDPSNKALDTYTTYNIDRKNNAGRTLGSYVFFWGNKQEGTATWFGMLLETGERLPSIDAMAYAWTGEWPADRAPKLVSLETPVAMNRVPAATEYEAVVVCEDREGGDIRYVWDIRAEASIRKVGGDEEPRPPSYPEAIKSGQGTDKITFSTPNRSGGYRIFVSCYDSGDGAAVHNLPFFVEAAAP